MVKYSSAVVALTAIALTNVEGFSTPYGSRTSFVPSTRKSTFANRSSLSPSFMSHATMHNTRNNMSMLVEPSGKDALKSISDSDKSVIAKTPSAIRKVVSTAAIPAGAIAGFLLTPSRRIIANAIGASITGIASTVGKSKLDSVTSQSAKPKIAELLLEKGTDGDAASLKEEIESIAKDYGVNIENGDLNAINSEIYSQYVVAMCKNPFAKTSELNELSQLRAIFGLSNVDVGDAHATAAAEFFRTITLTTTEEELEDEEHPDRMALDKLLWLSERSFRSGEETEEAFKFEMSRVAKALKVDYSDVKERVLSVAEPFYQRALASTRSKLDSGAVSVEMLSRARSSLGIDDYTKRDMHIDAFTEEIRSLLGKTEGQESEVSNEFVFPEGSADRLNRLKELLEIEAEDGNYEIANEVTPLFQSTVISALDRAIDTDAPESLWNEISARQAELLLSDAAMTPLLESAVVQKLGTPMEAAVNFAKVSNEVDTHKTLLEALKIKEAVFAVLEKSSSAPSKESLDEKYYSPMAVSSANGFMMPEDRKKLYTLFLAREIKNNSANEGEEKMTDESEAQLAEVATMLGMSDYDISDSARSTCGPVVEGELRAAAIEITGDDWTPALVENLKKRVDELVTKMKVPDDLLLEFSRNTYRDSLKIMAAKAPAGIPTVALKEQLDSLRDMLGFSAEDVAPMHYATFGPAYKKSVLESMGATGIIEPEYRDALTQLRERLGVDEESANKLFLSAVQDKMKPMVQVLANELERSMLTQQQLSQRRGVDMGEDVFKDGSGPKGTLGIGSDVNIMSEIMNLIDFYKENDIAVKTEVEGEEEITFPVTALGISAVQPEIAEALYRQFMVSGFTAQGSKAAQYEGEAPFFGGLLGLSEEQMDKTSESIATMVYENYVQNSLKSKTSLDQQDMMFLANIQTKLNLDSEQSGELMIAAQRKFLFDEANTVFQNPSAASIKAFRERANSLGLELLEDVGLSKDRVETLFEMEVQAGIDSGEITTASGELLTEIQESLGLSPEECVKLMESLVERKSDLCLKKIQSELLRGRDESCIPEIKSMLSYVSFVGGEVEGLQIDEETANKIVNIYESLDFGDEDVGAVSEKKSLLRVAVGLSQQ